MKILAPFCLILFLFNSAYSQKLAKEGRCFTYDGYEYCGIENIDNLFSQNSEANYWYTKSKSSRSNATNSGILSILGMTASYFILTNADPGPRTGPILTTTELAGVGVLLASCVAGVVALVSNVGATDQDQKAIDVFNGELLDHYTSPKAYQLSFQSSDYGIGAIVTF